MGSLALILKMNTQTIIIPGNPPSDNHLYGHSAFGKRVIKYMTAKGKAYKVLARSCVGECECTAKPVRMQLDIYFGDRRARDIQNHTKALIDALESMCYVNDSQIAELVITKNYDKQEPRAVVQVWSIM